jgi:hypothetical protein
MTRVNLLHVSGLGCHSQGLFQIKGLKSQHANIGMHRPRWNDYNIKIIKSIQLINVKLYCCDIKIVS